MCVDVLIFKRFVQFKAVPVVNNVVIPAHNYISRRHIGRNLHFHGKFVFSFLRLIFSQKAFARPFMCNGLLHWNDRIYWDYKIRAERNFSFNSKLCKFVVRPVKSSSHSYEVSACWIADYSHLAGVYSVFRSPFADNLYCPLQVFKHCRIMISALRSAVSQRKWRYSLWCKPFCRFVAFVVQSQMVIASAGADNDGSIPVPCVFVRFVHIHYRFRFFHRRNVFPNPYRFSAFCREHRSYRKNQ